MARKTDCIWIKLFTTEGMKYEKVSFYARNGCVSKLEARSILDAIIQRKSAVHGAGYVHRVQSILQHRSKDGVSNFVLGKGCDCPETIHRMNPVRAFRRV